MFRGCARHASRRNDLLLPFGRLHCNGSWTRTAEVEARRHMIRLSTTSQAQGLFDLHAMCWGLDEHSSDHSLQREFTKLDTDTGQAGMTIVLSRSGTVTLQQYPVPVNFCRSSSECGLLISTSRYERRQHYESSGTGHISHQKGQEKEPARSGRRDCLGIGGRRTNN